MILRIPILIGLLLLLSPLAVNGAPQRPDLISRYARALIDEAEGRLSALPGSSSDPCDAALEREVVSNMRLMFREAQNGFALPQEDVARSACFTSDIVGLERYVRDLLMDAVLQAESCNGERARSIVSIAAMVWDGISKLRQYGLDPEARAPVTGSGSAAPPPGATPQSDDALCPYTSQYAATGFADAGCQYADLFPSAATSRLKEEAGLMRRILFRALGDGFFGIGSVELPFFRDLLSRFWNATDLYVSNVTRQRSVLPLYRFTPTFTLRSVPNAGESGCLGWPSDVTAGPVTGEDIALQQYFPFILTDELAEMIAFLEERDGHKWQEYVRSFREELASNGSFNELLFLSYGTDVASLNRDHLSRESSLIFSLREPQERYERLADRLHESTRRFAQQAVTMPGSAFDPPLRTFVREYATFLARMCQNRGCGDNLIRAVELSRRDECFSSFLQDQFFRDHPSERTLESCRAIYTGR
jgi:hypothetical protein